MSIKAYILFTCGFFVAGCIAFANAATNPTDQDRAAFLKGVQFQRVIDIFQNPRSCGIVLLRERCIADLHVVAGKAAETPEFQKEYGFAISGDISTYPPQLGEANSLGPSEKLPWDSAPVASWLQAAGSAYVLSLGESDIIHQMFAMDYAGAVVFHAKNAGQYVDLIPLTLQKEAAEKGTKPPQAPAAGKMAMTSSPIALEQVPLVQQIIVSNLGPVFPVEAQPRLATTPGLVGDARLGIYQATFNELGESPQVLLEPQTRAFALELIRLEISQGASADGWTANSLEQAVSTARSSDDVGAFFQAIQEKLNASYLQTLPMPRRLVNVHGMLIAQGAYNAAVLHDSNFDGLVRSQIAQETSLDGLIPGFSDARKAFLASTPGDWVIENADLSKMVRMIIGTN